MAIAATPVAGAGGANLAIFDITALDADTTNSFAHGLAFTPDHIVVTPMVAGCYVGQLSVPAVSVTAANFTVNKLNAAGSGGAVPGTTVVARVEIGRNHSIIK